MAGLEFVGVVDRVGRVWEARVSGEGLELGGGYIFRTQLERWINYRFHTGRERVFFREWSIGKRGRYLLSSPPLGELTAPL